MTNRPTTEERYSRPRPSPSPTGALTPAPTVPARPRPARASPSSTLPDPVAHPTASMRRPVGAATTTPLPPPRPPRTATAYHGAPAGKTGHPLGKIWSNDWVGPDCVVVDFDRFDSCVTEDGRQTSMYAVTAKAWPKDSSLATPRLNQRPLSDPPRSQNWTKDACGYCLYRPKKPNTTAPWCTGTGEGNHNPYRCLSLKRYLAEGGESSNTPAEKAFLQSCLHFRPLKPTN
jgi:hypothetical protein